MIKVENTRIHHVGYYKETPQHIGVPKDVLVADAELVLVSNYKLDIKPEDIKLFGKDNIFKLGNFENCITILESGFINYKPILISRTEKSKHGDLVYNSDSKSIIIRDNKDYLDSVEYGFLFKILALTEHFSQSQLKMIVDGKLKDGMTVLLECEEIKS